MMTVGFFINMDRAITTWSARPFLGAIRQHRSLAYRRDATVINFGISTMMGCRISNGLTSILIDPPFNTPSEPVVRIETPESNGSYSGVLTVRGIAYDPDVRITRLDLLIDGTARGMIQINQLRTDICSAEQLRGCPGIGFIRQNRPDRL